MSFFTTSSSKNKSYQADWISLTRTRTPERTFSKEGYTCYDLAPNSTMQVLPSDLLPQKLCVCLPGWHGAGASCHKCPVDTFKPDLGDMECAECPRSTSTNGIVGAQSEDACQCKQTLRDHKGGQEKDSRSVFQPFFWPFVFVAAKPQFTSIRTRQKNGKVWLLQ